MIMLVGRFRRMCLCVQREKEQLFRWLRCKPVEYGLGREKQNEQGDKAGEQKATRFAHLMEDNHYQIQFLYFLVPQLSRIKFPLKSQLPEALVSVSATHT